MAIIPTENSQLTNIHHVFQPVIFMEIAIAKAETTTRRATTHTQAHIHKHTHNTPQLLTWQHDIKSLAERKQVDDSTVRWYIQGTEIILLPKGPIM